MTYIEFFQGLKHLCAPWVCRNQITLIAKRGLAVAFTVAFASFIFPLTNVSGDSVNPGVYAPNSTPYGTPYKDWISKMVAVDNVNTSFTASEGQLYLREVRKQTRRSCLVLG